MQEQSFPGSHPALNQPIDELALAEIKSAILTKLRLAIGKDAGMATRRDWYKAAALALRDRIVHRWLVAEKQSYDAGRKRVYYLSLEFLIGRLFTDALNNMGLLPVFEAALGDLGVGLSDLRKCEPDAALGNGGLGRLAACFMESMATLAIPAIGYGIRYDFGLFRQIIAQGWQHEYPDEWLGFGNPWEFQRPEVVYPVYFGGHVEHADDRGRDRATWRPAETVEAMAYDTPIVGWRGQHVNALRLWSAHAPDPLKLDIFNSGDYLGAVAEEARAESICKFLYPNDESAAGRELRLRQEYFFVSASLQDLVKRHLSADGQLRSLSSKVAVQLNDTHPSLAVTELMRILVDLHNFRWDEAWKITVATLSYTNHTLLPEALETWPVELFERLLPRNLEIIYRINVAHLALADQRCPGDIDFRASVSLIDEKSGRRVRMGQLAFVGSHRINGVSAMHSDLMKETVFNDLNHLYPGRITNKTNGITFRRWLMLANPGLTDLIREVCGEAVLDDFSLFEHLEARASDNAIPAALPRRQAPQQAGAGAADRRAQQHQGRSVGAVRRPDQAHPRIQAATAQYPRGGRAVSGDQGRTAARLGAAGKNLRRQGGGELSLRQADHQADQRRRRNRQQRSRHRRAAEGRVPRRLQCQPGRGDHSRRRPFRADFDRGHGGLRHRQHEAGAQRRADHRHARRRQYRNPRSCRRREHRDLRHGGSATSWYGASRDSTPAT